MFSIGFNYRSNKNDEFVIYKGDKPCSDTEFLLGLKKALKNKNKIVNHTNLSISEIADQIIQKYKDKKCYISAGEIIRSSNQINSLCNKIKKLAKDEEELFEGLSDFFESKTMLSMPKDNPFFGTDLVVFSNSYKGLLPLNGIRKRDLKKATEFFNDLKENRTVFNLNEQDKTELSDLFRQLMTRAIGRRLVYRLNSHKEKGAEVEINYLPLLTEKISSDVALISRKQSRISLLRDGNFDTISRVGREGRLQRFKSPQFLSLGHELIHILHSMESKSFQSHVNRMKQSPKTSPRFDTIEEEETITPSVTKESHFAQSFEEAELYPWEDEDILLENITENSLRASFGMAMRTGHRGVIEKPLGLEVANVGQNYFNRVCRAGLYDEVKEILEAGAVKITSETLISAAKGGNLDVVQLLLSQRQKTLSERNQGLILKAAVTSGNVPLVKHLVEKEKFSVSQPDALWGYTLILNALQTKTDSAVPLMDFLLSQGALLRPNKIKEEAEPFEFQLMKVAAEASDDRIFNRLIQLGIDPWKKDIHGNQALSVAAEAGNLAVLSKLCKSPQHFYWVHGRKTLLHSAALSNDFATIDFVLKKDQEFKKRSQQQFSLINRGINAVLRQALANQNYKLIFLALKNGATVHEEDLNLFVEFALQRKSPRREKLLDLLFQRDDSSDQQTTVQRLVEAIQNNEHSLNLLMGAVQRNDRKLLDYLKKKGININ